MVPLEAGFWFVAADRDVDEEADNDDEADDVVVVVVTGLDDTAAGLVDAAAAAVFEMFSRAFKLSELENGAGAEVAVVTVVVAVSPVLAGVARRCAGFLRCSFHARLRTAGALFTGSNDRFNSKSSSICRWSTQTLTDSRASERAREVRERAGEKRNNAIS
mgnify:CR=1 FL=1